MIILIGAFGLNGELGKEDGLPLWNLPDEYNRFRQLIRGYPIIMGRKSFDVIKEPLEGSLNIIITRQKNFRAEGAIVVHTIEDAIKAAGQHLKVFVIGGGDIFTLAIPYADKMELSRIDATFPEAEAFFPPFSQHEWQLVSSVKHEADKQHAYSFTYETWVRKRADTD